MAFFPINTTNSTVPPAPDNRSNPTLSTANQNGMSELTSSEGTSPRPRNESSRNQSQGGGGGVKPLEFKAAMHDFGVMFPTLDPETIETVLRSNNGAVDATIDQLLEMCDSFGVEKSTRGTKSSSQTRNRTQNNQPNPNSLAVDNVDSYNMHLASVTPPKNPESVLTDSNMYANLPFQESKPAIETNESSVATSYRYQTALYKFNNPFLGPLPDDFLRIMNDATFDRDMKYSHERRKQVDDIKNERLKPTHYISDGKFNPENDFGRVIAPAPSADIGSAASAWSEPDRRVEPPSNPPTMNPATGILSDLKAWHYATFSPINSFTDLTPLPT